MAKQSSVNKNNRRKKLVARYAVKRKALKAAAADLTKPAEVRFAARLKLAQLPRNASPVRLRIRREYPNARARCHPAVGQPFGKRGVPFRERFTRRPGGGRRISRCRAS